VVIGKLYVPNITYNLSLTHTAIMQLIVCSTPEILSDEQQLVHELIQSGLQTFHLRKPLFSIDEMRNWLQKMQRSDHHRVVIHSHWSLTKEFQLKGIHIGATVWKKLPVTEQQAWWTYAKENQLTISSSVHNQEEINRLPQEMDYVWLSPVFESLSKQAYKSDYNTEQFDAWVKELKEKKQTKVYALGGITSTHIPELVQRKFDGAVVLGNVWNSIAGLQDKELVRERIKQLIVACQTDLIS
jgi:thiamine-phosphate pyrophosphorylase